MAENQKGFVPLQQLQAMARQKLGEDYVPTQRQPTACPPKPQGYDQEMNNETSNSIQNKSEKVVKREYKKQINTTMPQSHVFTKYQIKQDTCFYIRFGISWTDDDRLIVTQQDKLNPNIESHWLKFRMWTYEECSRFKNACCQLDKYKQYIYNKQKLLKEQVKHLLLDWSFGINDSNMRLMHVNGILSDESINLFMNMHPNILFHVEDSLKAILEGNR